MTKKIILLGIGAVAAFVILLTVVAIALETNPPVTQEPNWDSPQTRALAQRACFDCHSNQTTWPWYSKMPVGSWISVFDTLRGRRELNFSQWSTQSQANPGRASRRAREIGEVIQEGSMPPALYTMMHPNAILNEQEKQQLIDGLTKTLQQ